MKKGTKFALSIVVVGVITLYLNHYDIFSNGLLESNKIKDDSLCNIFKPVANENCTHATSVSMTGHYGRLGNRIIAIINMIAYARKKSCNIIMPQNLLEDSPSFLETNPKKTCFTPTTKNFTESINNSLCGSETAKYWFDRDPFFARSSWYERGNTVPCATRLLSTYFDINKTHALGRACPKSPYIVLHVRSGDIVKGHYDEDEGIYLPNKVSRFYAPYPTSFYVSVLKDIAMRNSGSRKTPQVFVLCETLDNPTCDYLQKTADIFSDSGLNLILRVEQRLEDDLHIMLCAREVAMSYGSLKIVLAVSQRLKIRHEFLRNEEEIWQNSHDKFNKCTSADKFYWIANNEKRKNYRTVTRYWNNTGFQRYTIDRYYEIASSCSTAKKAADIPLMKRDNSYWGGYLLGLSLFITGVFVGVVCMMNNLDHNERRRKQFIRYSSLVLLLICFLSVFFKLGIMIGEAIVVYKGT